MRQLDRFKPRIQALPSRPQLRPGYKLIEVKPGRYLLHSGLRTFEIQQHFPGSLLPNMLTQMAGERYLEEVLVSLSPFEIAFVLDVLETLQQGGLLSTGEDGVEPRYAYHSLLFDHLRQQKADDAQIAETPSLDLSQRLCESRVVIVGLGRVGSQLARLLTIAGVGHITGVDSGVVEEGVLCTDAWYSRRDIGRNRVDALRCHLEEINGSLEFQPLPIRLQDRDSLPNELLGHDMLLVVVDQPAPALYEMVNRCCMEAGLPWLSYRMAWDGLVVEIGPTVIPHETACYACYQQLRHSNLLDPGQDEAVARELNGSELPLLNPQITPCVSLMCYEVLRFLSGAAHPLTLNGLLTFDISTAQQAAHTLFKLPRCPVCRRDVGEFAPTRFWSELQDEWSVADAREADNEPL